MPKGKRARPKGTKCPNEAFLPEAIFNYVPTVEEYVFALFEGKKPKHCEISRKIVKMPGIVRDAFQMVSFFSFMLSNISFSLKPCGEKSV